MLMKKERLADYVRSTTNIKHQSFFYNLELLYGGDEKPWTFHDPVERESMRTRTQMQMLVILLIALARKMVGAKTSTGTWR
jgi:hypothetical protein